LPRNETTDLKLGISAMNAITFGTAARKRLGVTSDEPKLDKPLDAAWLVLEAANDLGDDVTVEICRRVIDASLRGTQPLPSDLHVVLDYFR
jgi:hypothetical protein